MAVLPIRVYPDPVLRLRCPEVERFDDQLRRLVADMVETMYAAPGIGLAAPQVGVERRVAVVDLSVGEEEGALHVLVNPEIVDREGQASELEGCLSIPDVTEKVERPTRIVVRSRDLDGGEREDTAEGWLARAICHEVDHLDGVLFVERLHGLRRQRALRRLRRLKREWEERSQEAGVAG